MKDAHGEQNRRAWVELIMEQRNREKREKLFSIGKRAVGFPKQMVGLVWSAVKFQYL